MRKNKKTGFTFIELLIVVAVLMILASIAIPRYNEFNRRRAVKSAARELYERIGEAQSLAQKNEGLAYVKFTYDKGHLSYLIEQNNNGIYKGNLYDRYMGSGLFGVNSSTVIAFGPGGTVDESETINIPPQIEPETPTYYQVFVKRYEDDKYYFEIRVYKTGKLDFIQHLID